MRLAQIAKAGWVAKLCLLGGVIVALCANGNQFVPYMDPIHANPRFLRLLENILIVNDTAYRKNLAEMQELMAVLFSEGERSMLDGRLGWHDGIVACSLRDKGDVVRFGQIFPMGWPHITISHHLQNFGWCASDICDLELNERVWVRRENSELRKLQVSPSAELHIHTSDLGGSLGSLCSFPSDPKEKEAGHGSKGSADADNLRPSGDGGIGVLEDRGVRTLALMLAFYIGGVYTITRAQRWKRGAWILVALCGACAVASMLQLCLNG